MLRSPTQGRLHLQWMLNGSSRFRTGVSLHSHTLHSLESLSFIYTAARKASILAKAIRRGESRYRAIHGTELDLSRGWWTPPLGAHDAWTVEKSQIQSLDLRPLVSLTDHDNIDAPVSLQVLDECRGTPISLEWTVPFRATFFHLGVHHLPQAHARRIFAELDEFRSNPRETRLAEILAELSALPEVLVVFNHPLWDEKGIGESRHRTVVWEFLEKFSSQVHALEVNGLRPWRENHAVLGLAAEARKPLISGGDRHALEPNATLNLTNAESFGEFVSEIRAGWSDVLIMKHYREAFAWRIAHNMIDTLRTYEQHAKGWRLWSDRVFYRCEDGTVRSLTQLFGDKPPLSVAAFVGALHFASEPKVRRFLRGAFPFAEEVQF